MIKPLNEYELVKEMPDETFGFTASCFVRNGVVWNEYYVSYLGLDLVQINDIFYIDRDESIITYGKLPLAYRNVDSGIKVGINNHIIYSPKYKSDPRIIDPEYVCNINEDMEVEAIHLVNTKGEMVTVDIIIDHENDSITVANPATGATTVELYDDKKRMIESNLIIDDNILSTDKIKYDDENFEAIEVVTDYNGDVASLLHKLDMNGKRLYTISIDEENGKIDSITRRLNTTEDTYIEFCKFKTFNK